jgi:septal ring factor EnvC (AmiA/AmiB activator)
MREIVRNNGFWRSFFWYYCSVKNSVMKHSILIACFCILVSCSFKSERKAQINQRIRELEQRIEQRSNQEEIYREALGALMIDYQRDVEKMPESRFDRLQKFGAAMEPISRQLSELEAQDKADEAEIGKLVEQRSRL